MELILFRSNPALVDLPGKPFCSYLFRPSELDSDPTKKNFASSDSSLRHPIGSRLWPQISDSTTETLFVSGDGLQALQGAGKNFRPELSQRSCCFFIYDGNPSILLVSPMPDYLLHLRCIHRMDPGLPGRSLSHGCHRRSPAGIWNHEGLFILFSAFSELRGKRLISSTLPRAIRYDRDRHSDSSAWRCFLKRAGGRFLQKDNVDFFSR